MIKKKNPSRKAENRLEEYLYSINFAKQYGNTPVFHTYASLFYVVILIIHMMVDPISLAVVSGVSMVSMIVGRFSKNSSSVQETVHQSSDGKLQFVTLKRVIDPQQFIPLINQGNAIFLNIRALYSQAEKLSEFLYNLEIISKRHDLALKQISSDLLLFTNKSQLTRLSPSTIAVNRDPSFHNIKDKPIEVQAS